MPLANKLGITVQEDLALQEERLSKIRARELFDLNKFSRLQAGSTASLLEIHRYLFQDVYDFAGETRKVNLAKGTFRFAPLAYLDESLKMVELLPQGSLVEIIDKYIEMNLVHPFREGNGRSTRIWLDLILKTELKRVVNWTKISKDEYFQAMKISPVRNTEIRAVIRAALTDDIDNRDVYLTGIDASFAYEGLEAYITSKLNSINGTFALEPR